VSHSAESSLGTHMPLSRVLHPPVFDDEAKTHQTFLLHVVLWSMVVVPLP